MYRAQEGKGSKRVENCSYNSGYEKQTRKYSFWKACRLASRRHINLSPKGLEGDIAGHLAAPKASLCPPKQLLVNPVGVRRLKGKGRSPGCWDVLLPSPLFRLRVTYSAACPEVLGTKSM